MEITGADEALANLAPASRSGTGRRELGPHTVAAVLDLAVPVFQFVAGAGHPRHRAIVRRIELEVRRHRLQASDYLARAGPRQIDVLQREQIRTDGGVHHVESEVLHTVDDFAQAATDRVGIAFRRQDLEDGQIAGDQVRAPDRRRQPIAELVQATHCVRRAKRASEHMRILEPDPEQAEVGVNGLGTLAGEPLQD